MQPSWTILLLDLCTQVYVCCDAIWLVGYSISRSSSTVICFAFFSTSQERMQEEEDLDFGFTGTDGFSRGAL